MSDRPVYIGTDSGATTSKVGAVWDDGTTVSTRLLQHPTNSTAGPQAVVAGWVEAVTHYLDAHGLGWDQVSGIGLAIPGPFLRYGVLGPMANLPPIFEGFDVHNAYTAALSTRAGRPIPLVVGNDGDFGGVAEAQHARGDGDGSVVMLAPGSGLGCAYIDGRGLPLTGDFFAGMEAGHMPAAIHELNVKPYKCGCGRTWGCVEVYTTISGLPYLLADRLPDYPDHELANPDIPIKLRVLSLRGLAQHGDPLALSIFDFQASALGFHVASLAMALDPKFFVIGGGLMDPEATTESFRSRYLNIVRETALPNLFPAQQTGLSILPAALGDLSQAIGAALVALLRSRR